MKEVALVIFVLASVDASASASSEEGRKEPFPQMRAPFFALVEERKPTAAVVVSAEPPQVEAFAVEEFLAYVKNITGRFMMERSRSKGLS